MTKSLGRKALCWALHFAAGFLVRLKGTAVRSHSQPSLPFSRAT